MNNDVSKRIEWIDIAKGIGILLVVLGHVLNKHTYIWNVITLFHMPLFYIISGYLHRTSGESFFGGVLRKKSKQLWFPYVLASVAVYMVELFCGRVSFSIKTVIKYLLMLETPGILGAAWFVSVLFYSELLMCLLDYFFVVLQWNKKMIFYDILILSFYMVGMLTQFPYGFSRVLVALGYLYFGRKLRTTEYLIDNNKNMIGFLLLSFVILCISGVGCYSSYSSNVYASVIVAIICSVCGSHVVLMCSKKIEEVPFFEKYYVNQFLRYLGRNTLGVSFFHFIAFRIVNVLIVFFNDLPTHRILDFPVIYDCSLIWKGVYIIAAFLISNALFVPVTIATEFIAQYFFENVDAVLTKRTGR